MQSSSTWVSRARIVDEDKTAIRIAEAAITPTRSGSMSLRVINQDITLNRA